MKNQRQPSGSQFGPRQHMSRRKAKCIRGELMKTSLKDFKRSRTYMQPIMKNRNCNGNRRDNGVTYKSNCNVKDRRDKVVPQPMRQVPPKDRNIKLSDSSIVNENFVPMANSASKSNHALAPSSKDLKQATTSRFENFSISLSRNIKCVHSPRPNNEFSSKYLEKHVPLRLKDDSNATLGCSKKSHTLKAKEGLVCNSNNVERSNSRPNHLKAMPGLVHKAKKANALNQCNNVGCLKKSHPLQVKEGLICNSNNIEISNSQSNHLEATPGLVHKAKNVDELNQCNNVLSSRSKERSNHDQGESIVVREGNIERFKSLNENMDELNQCDNDLGSRSMGRSNPDRGENIVVREDNIERFKSLNGKGVLTTSKVPNLSMSKEPLVPNKAPLNDKKCQDEVMNDKDKEIEGHPSVASTERIMSGEVHFVCDDHHKQEDFLKARDAPNSHQRVVASCMDDNMEWNGDPLEECIQLDGRNRNTKFAKGDRTDDVKLKRKRIEPLPEEQPMTHVYDDSEEAENSRPMNKRRRYREIIEDEEADDLSPIGVEDDTAGLTSQTAILKDHHPKVSTPFVSECVEQQCYNYSQPIDEPIWSGIFKIGNKEYVSLAAHLSIKSCEKVWTLSRSLLPVVEVTKLSRSEVWPKSWKASRPTDDSIGLYFFPHKMRPDERMDQLVKEVMENDIVLRAVTGEAEMLIFPSIVLPEPYQTFQRKHYLWGVFKRRNDMVAVVEEHHGTGHPAQEEKMEKQHASHQQDKVQCEESDQETLRNRAMRLKKQRLLGTDRGVDHQDELQCEEPLMKPAMRLKKQRLMGAPQGVEKVEASTPQVEASCVPGHNIETELKAPEDANTQDVDKELTPSLAGSNAPRLAERNTEATSAPTRPATASDHGQMHSSLGVSPGKMFAFIVRQTPRLEQLIQEMEREGALVVAMQGR